jgi:SAM-dependent methyltransferase
VLRWADRVPAGGRVLDLACGSGRHARYFATRGCPVEAVDRDPAALAALAGVPGVTTRCADLEGGPWPYDGERFVGIVVANYLHRPLFPRLLDCIAPEGVMITRPSPRATSATAGRPIPRSCSSPASCWNGYAAGSEWSPMKTLLFPSPGRRACSVFAPLTSLTGMHVKSID